MPAVIGRWAESGAERAHAGLTRSRSCILRSEGHGTLEPSRGNESQGVKKRVPTRSENHCMAGVVVGPPQLTQSWYLDKESGRGSGSRTLPVVGR